MTLNRFVRQPPGDDEDEWDDEEEGEVGVNQALLEKMAKSREDRPAPSPEPMVMPQQQRRSSAGYTGNIPMVSRNNSAGGATPEERIRRVQQGVESDGDDEEDGGNFLSRFFANLFSKFKAGKKKEAKGLEKKRISSAGPSIWERWNEWSMPLKVLSIGGGVVGLGVIVLLGLIALNAVTSASERPRPVVFSPDVVVEQPTVEEAEVVIAESTQSDNETLGEKYNIVVRQAVTDGTTYASNRIDKLSLKIVSGQSYVLVMETPYAGWAIMLPEAGGAYFVPAELFPGSDIEMVNKEAPAVGDLLQQAKSIKDSTGSLTSTRSQRFSGEVLAITLVLILIALGCMLVNAVMSTHGIDDLIFITLISVMMLIFGWIMPMVVKLLSDGTFSQESMGFALQVGGIFVTIMTVVLVAYRVFDPIVDNYVEMRSGVASTGYMENEKGMKYEVLPAISFNPLGDFFSIMGLFTFLGFQTPLSFAWGVNTSLRPVGFNAFVKSLGSGVPEPVTMFLINMCLLAFLGYFIQALQAKKAGSVLISTLAVATYIPIRIFTTWSPVAVVMGIILVGVLASFIIRQTIRKDEYFSFVAMQGAVPVVIIMMAFAF